MTVSAREAFVLGTPRRGPERPRGADNRMPPESDPGGNVEAVLLELPVFPAGVRFRIKVEELEP
jgi:hypothetical protein